MTFATDLANDLSCVRTRPLQTQVRPPHARCVLVRGEIADMAICKNRIETTLMPRDLAHPSGEPGAVPLPADSATLRNAPIRMLRLAQVIDITGLRKTKIYELQSEGRFPMRVQITAHSVGWIEEEVQAWLARRGVPGNAAAAAGH